MINDWGYPISDKPILVVICCINVVRIDWNQPLETFLQSFLVHSVQMGASIVMGGIPKIVALFHGKSH